MWVRLVTLPFMFVSIWTAGHGYTSLSDEADRKVRGKAVWQTAEVVRGINQQHGDLQKLFVCRLNVSLPESMLYRSTLIFPSTSFLVSGGIAHASLQRTT